MSNLWVLGAISVLVLLCLVLWSNVMDKSRMGSSQNFPRRTQLWQGVPPEH